VTAWFRRLADVPDVGYTGDAQVKRSTLPGHETVPTLSVYTFEGKRQESLLWPTANGTTSQSPASLHMGVVSSTQPVDPSSALLQRLHEALELPGTVSDYHFAIQRCVEQLWKRRRQEPALLHVVERLCWLDIRLIEARPETIISPKKGSATFFQVLAFSHLVELYSDEGFLNEALEIAERGARLNQKTPVAELQERLARIKAEES
jgi:hypothetical protein